MQKISKRSLKDVFYNPDPSLSVAGRNDLLEIFLRSFACVFKQFKEVGVATRRWEKRCKRDVSDNLLEIFLIFAKHLFWIFFISFDFHESSSGA